MKNIIVFDPEDINKQVNINKKVVKLFEILLLLTLSTIKLSTPTSYIIFLKLF